MRPLKLSAEAMNERQARQCRDVRLGADHPQQHGLAVQMGREDGAARGGDIGHVTDLRGT